MTDHYTVCFTASLMCSTTFNGSPAPSEKWPEMNHGSYYYSWHSYQILPRAAPPADHHQEMPPFHHLPPKAGDSFKTTHTFDLTVFSLAFPRGLTTPFTFRQGCAHPTWLGVHVSHLGPAPLLTGLEVSRGEHLHFSAPVSGAQQAQSYCHWAPGWGRRQASCFMHVNELHPYS